jgi:predicted PilT family ATPase
MNTNRTERLSEIDADAASTAPEFEGEIREFIRRDASLRRPVRADATAAGEGINTLLDRVAGASIEEIDRVIRELQAMRDTLVSEGDRVQREVARFAGLSQTAMASVRVIADSLTQWERPDGLHNPAAE